MFRHVLFNCRLFLVVYFHCGRWVLRHKQQHFAPAWLTFSKCASRAELDQTWIHIWALKSNGLTVTCQVGSSMVDMYVRVGGSIPLFSHFLLFDSLFLEEMRLKLPQRSRWQLLETLVHLYNEGKWALSQEQWAPDMHARAHTHSCAHAHWGWHLFSTSWEGNPWPHDLTNNTTRNGHDTLLRTHILQCNWNIFIILYFIFSHILFCYSLC